MAAAPLGALLNRLPFPMADAVLTLDPVSGRSHDTVLLALRRLKGRATLGDITAETGLERAEAEAALRRLLEQRRGHLEVGESGDIVYRFDRRLISREAEPFWSRVRRGAWKAFTWAFKVWIVAMLLVYFVIFMALLLAAIFAGNRDNDNGGWGGDSRGGRRSGGLHLPLGDIWLWYWLWSPDWRRRPYYGEGYGGGYGGDDARGHAGARRGGRGRRDGPPFYKKVFAFVFGPDEPRRSRADRDREHLRFIRARRGVVSTADFVTYSGLERQEAEEELARLMAAHEGDVSVSSDGTLLYRFPELMVSAHGTVEDREPAPAWQRLEPARPVTGNSSGTNAMIAGLNGFNLVAAASAPLFIFPRLGIGGPAAEIALIWVPLAFSATFFAVPLLRRIGVTRENTRRALRNVRKVMLGMATRSDELVAPTVRARLNELLKGKLGAKVAPDLVFDRLVAEFDGEVERGTDDVERFRFPTLHRELAAAAASRADLALEQREVGEIVYASDDDSVSASQRDLAAFDDELKVAVRDERQIAALEFEAQNTRTENLNSRPMRGMPHWS